MIASRRRLLQLVGLGSLAGAAASVRSPGSPAPVADLHATPMDQMMHAMGSVGRVSTEAFDPTVFLRSWNFSHLPSTERSRYYTETPRPDGTLLREYEFFAVDREIEIAPGIFFPAWTYNGQVPGPTIRATEGDRIRVRFLNQGSHPHSIHFHGWHPPGMDGALPSQQVRPGGEFVYEFTAEPFGVHLYHCHTAP
ncbi:MAG: multicopper oxidase domain-containing protein, partial [Acidobacteria bacterium]|nr:multicopper oxidase domain-containing protein [Acidobacteriota bacterium]